MDVSPLQLKYFTDPSILQQLGHNRLARFFQDFERDLLEAGNPLPFPSLEDPTGLDRLAAAFARTEPLPERMRNALFLIEAAASTENAELLESVILRRLPCISLNRSCPLDCALELWFACPDELPQFQSSSFSSSTCVPALEPHEAGLAAPKSDGGARFADSPIYRLSDTPSATAPRFDATTLLDSLTHVLTRFVVLPKYVAETIALFVPHTYAFELRDVTTYIGVQSPVRRCGKSTLLTLLSRLVNRPVVAANVSSSSLFHAVEELQPTLIIDEADTFFKARGELQGILNAGYHKPMAYVLRVSNEPRTTPRHVSPASKEGSALNTENCTPNTSNVPDPHSFNPINPFNSVNSSLRHFSTWCPKVIAQIGHLPHTLADRCIVFTMQRKSPGQKCERLRDLTFEDLQRQCALFIAENRDAIASARPEIPDGLNDRAADIWEPLLALADLAGGDWSEKARKAALALSGSSNENAPIAALLLDIYLVFVRSKTDRIFTRDLVQHLDRCPADRAWRELKGSKQVTEVWLAKQLRPYGITPRTMRINGRLGKGYLNTDFEEACRSYIPKSELEV